MNLFKKWFDCFAPSEILTCVFPDGRDHTMCCKESLVPSACDNICQFSQHDELTADFITCVSYTGIIANCYREGLGDFLLIRYFIVLFVWPWLHTSMVFLYITDQYYSYTSETASEFQGTEVYITRCVPSLATTQSYQYSDRELLRHL